MTLLSAASLLLALLVLPAALYLGLLGIMGRREGAAIYAHPRLRLAVVMPAHDEEARIAATVASLRAADYPPDLRYLIVLADNCRDETATVARDAGAAVIERHDPEHPGKGQALAYAFDRILAATDVDAIVVVDADTLVSPNLLTALSARILAGAHAVQAEYSVRNFDTSWRTRLMTLALALFHRTRSLARERLGLSVGLRGNGMCFSRELLTCCPHHAFGLVEDLEYGIHIGLAGYRVAYASEAKVLGEMVSRADVAVSQRRRWEHGRLQLARASLGPLLRAAASKRSPMLLDLAVDLTVPPLTYMALVTGAGLVLDASLTLGSGTPTLGLYVWGVAAASILIYVARGVSHAGLGIRGLGVLAYAPVYMAWKLVSIGPNRPPSWVRTQREAEK